MTPEREQILKDIEQSVCEQFGVTSLGLRSRRTQQDLVEARVYFAFLCTLKGFHPEETADFLGKDRSTIIRQLEKMGVVNHACKSRRFTGTDYKSLADSVYLNNPPSPTNSTLME